MTGVPYIGESTLTAEEKKDMSVPEATTMKAVKPFLNKGYNVTMYNWFTGSSLADKLLENNTTIVGTLRSNKRDIPKVANDITGRIKKSAKFYKSGNQILLSYWDEGKKPVLVLSTMHASPTSMENGLPVIISCYNLSKSGVDNMDHMIRMYTSKRKCFRWPYRYFFSLVTLVCLMQQLNASTSQAKTNAFRFVFLTNVGYQLLHAHISKRFIATSSKTILLSMSLLSYTSSTCDDDDNVVLRHTLPVFTGLGRCPIVSWDFAGAVSILDRMPVLSFTNDFYQD